MFKTKFVSPKGNSSKIWYLLKTSLFPHSLLFAYLKEKIFKSKIHCYMFWVCEVCSDCRCHCWGRLTLWLMPDEMFGIVDQSACREILHGSLSDFIFGSCALALQSKFLAAWGHCSSFSQSSRAKWCPMGRWFPGFGFYWL